MQRAAGRRYALAWALYASVLFAVLHCGIGHGQAMGLVLNGAGGAFCGHAVAAPGPTNSEQWPGDSLADTTTLDCPLCSHAGLAFTPSMPDLPAARPMPGQALPAAPEAWPRRCWPSANPRASPALA